MDEPDDMARAYCAAGEKRAEIISFVMKAYDIDHSDELTTASIQSAYKALNEMMSTILSGKVVVADDVYSSAILCFRTNLWEQRFKNLLDGKVHFLALGAAHLFPNTGPVATCPGLLEDLQQSGYTVEKVR